MKASKVVNDDDFESRVMQVFDAIRKDLAAVQTDLDAIRKDLAAVQTDLGDEGSLVHDLKQGTSVGTEAPINPVCRDFLQQDTTGYQEPVHELVKILRQPSRKTPVWRS